MDSVQKVVQKFLLHPTYIQNGAAYLSSKWNIDTETIKEARTIARSQLKDYNVKQVWSKSSDFSIRLDKVAKQIDYLEEIRKDFKELNLENQFEINLKKKEERADSNLLVISLNDIHINKKDNTSQSVEDYAHKVLATFNTLLETANSYSNVEKILLVCGHDFFNSDFNHSTTAGTPQTDTDEHYKAFKIGLNLCVTLIKNAGQYASVDFVIVNGNHDKHTSLYLGVSLEEIFKNHKDTVSIQFKDKERMYYQFYSNAFMLTHNLPGKMAETGLLFAIENSTLFGNCTNRYILSGHLHKQSKDEFSLKVKDEMKGVVFKVCPALCVTDSWHDSKGYVGNNRMLEGMLYHKDKGLKADLYETISE